MKRMGIRVVLACLLLVVIALPVLAEDFTALLIVAGRDPWNEAGYADADALIVAAYREANGVRMLSVDRDATIDVHGESWTLGALITKFGVEGALAGVNQYYGLDIAHFALIDMDGVPDLIDAAGGAQLTLDEADLRAIGYAGATGQYILRGDGIRAFLAQRDGEPPQDARTRRSQLFDAFVKQVMDGGAQTGVGFFLKLVGLVDTNVSFFQLTGLGVSVLKSGLGGIRRLSAPLSAAQVDGAAETESQAELVYRFLYA